MQKRNLAVGHFFNAPFTEACERHLPRIREVFFAWPGVLSCRPAPDYTKEGVRERLVSDLTWARANGIELDTLFNCNCYGDDAVSTTLADFIVRNLDEMGAAGLFPDTVTTTSPFVAAVLRRHFPSVKIRWSINLRVHGTVGFESVMELFDSFYVSREHHRDLAYLREVSDWARANGKTLGMQANSGCLRQCPFQTFHDNLHGHGDGRRPQDVAAMNEYGFTFFRCRARYESGAYEDFLRSTWLRPEDMPEYEDFVDVVKLATRRHIDPVAILDAYATYGYKGDLARLMDPVNPFPKPFRNEAFDENEDLWHAVRNCKDANNCRHCGRCTELYRRVVDTAS